MGSTQPKWKIKQKRQKINDARRALKNGSAKESPTGIKRVARH